MAGKVLVAIVFIVVQTIVQAFIQKPCNGATPLQVKGVNMFCGRGPKRVDCPKGSYCDIHPTDRYATCCRGDRECRNKKPGTPFVNARCTERCTCDKIGRKRCSPLCPQALVICAFGFTPKFFKELLPGTKCFCNKPRCVPVTPRPCYGDKLFVNPRTGKRIICFRSPCPKGAYCHAHPADQFAVCCKIKDPECRNRKPGTSFVNARCTERCTCDRRGRKRCSPLCPQVLIKCAPFYQPKSFRERIPGTKCFCNKPKCVPVTPRPCYGDKPLINAMNGRPLTCLRGRCPSEAFCHVHPAKAFAVCCRKQSKPGGCPKYRLDALCQVFTKPSCMSDRQCPGNKRCCPSLCSRTCLKPIPCGPLCKMYCKYGNVHVNGCPICKCKENPCKKEKCPPIRPCIVVNRDQALCAGHIDPECRNRKPGISFVNARCTERCTCYRRGKACSSLCPQVLIKCASFYRPKSFRERIPGTKCFCNKPKCVPVTPRPCYGDMPLINPVDSRSYSCFRRRCPSGAFCHFHPANAFAVCCRKQSKPGRCPKYRFPALCKGIIRPTCMSDRQCPGNKRCCPFLCSRRCLKPLPCGPVCYMYCKYGNVHVNGCLICKCKVFISIKENPCKKVRCPLIRPRCIVVNRDQALCVRHVVTPPPCYGDKLLINPVDGRPYNCFIHRCPKGAFCHSHPADQYSVCCRKQSKPGGCPKSSIVTICKFKLSRPACVSDHQCPGKKRCCPSGCSSKCVDPVPCSLFTCRIFCKYGKKVINGCPSCTCRENPCKDIKCPRIRPRCIVRNNQPLCIRHVVVPIPKPGKCPPPPNIVCVRAENKCFSDRECPGRQKCCPGGCGTLCRNPVPVVKPGKCPKLRSRVRCSNRGCRFDSDCKGRTKCCIVDRCGRHCVNPVPVVKPGKCPRLKSSVLCSKHRCRYDSDCIGKLKCCAVDKCGRHCLSPVPSAKPGGCPRQKDVLCNGYRCRSDSDCLGQQKCCETKHCGRNCVKPVPVTKPGKCPRLRSSVRCSRHRCTYDSDCIGKLKCCVVDRCGRQCVSPVFPVIKPGKCPPPGNIRCIRAENKCHYDNQCPGIQKCCAGGCGTLCRFPVVYKVAEEGDRASDSSSIGSEFEDVSAGLVKPGHCPDTSGIITTCQVTPLNCFSDSMCLGNLKCCSYGCGKRCLKPVPFKGK